MQKKLFDILPQGFDDVIIGGTDVIVSNIQIDSRKVDSESVFCAFRGVTLDGHDFIQSVIQKGVKVIVCESIVEPIDGVTYIIVKGNIRKFTGALLSNLFDNPTDGLSLIGVTGTNGKTTVCTLLYQLFSQMGYKCGLISTVQNIIGTEILKSTHTTPDIVSLYELIYKMQQSQCDYIFMEVSSHAIDQDRIAGLHYAVAGFTNISHDHLDYHKNMLAYINAKKAFFDQLNSTAFAITNIDDKNGRIMTQNTKAKIMTYSLRTLADLKGKVIENSISGIHMRINDIEAYFRMIGYFNAYNVLLVYGIAQSLGQNHEVFLPILTSLTGANGRFEITVGASSGINAIVDYAHTPDALLNVLSTIKDIIKNSGNIIVVIGAGGDRDKSKRPIMASIACSNADKVILTSDNPRSENPESILDDMEAGIEDAFKSKVLRITDRKQAIKTSVMIAKRGDVIVVAGKGHETYQEIKGEKFPFDDKKILESLLN